MANKKILLGMLVAALTFGMMVTGCDLDGKSESDTWENVTSLDQLNGTWKGTYNGPLSSDNFQSDDEGEDIFAGLLDNVTLNVSMDMTLTIDASAKTQASTIKMTMTFSGSDTESVAKAYVLFLVLFALGDQYGENITLNDFDCFDDIDDLEGFEDFDFNENPPPYSFTVTMNEPAETLTDDDIADLLSGMLINQNGTKIKGVSTGDSGTPNVEIIFTKQ